MSQRSRSEFDRLASPYDRGMLPLEKLWLRQMRGRLLPMAQGRILEVGIGTAANLPYYRPSVRLTAIDESIDMLALAADRARAVGRHVHLGQVDLQHLAFPTGSFDTVVASLVLCSVVEQTSALDEIHRVLSKPDGQLLLLEHVRPKSLPLSVLVDFLNVPWFALNGRCHLNRDTLQALHEADFRVEHTEARVAGLFRIAAARPV